MNVWLLIVYMLGQPTYMGVLSSYDECVQTALQPFYHERGMRVVCSPKIVEIDPQTGKLYYLQSERP